MSAAANVPAVPEDARGQALPEPFVPQPVEWESILADGVPELEYLSKPYIPMRRRSWWVGAAESGKSIRAQHESCGLTRAGFVVVYVSQENGLEEEARRFLRLRPDFSRLRLYVDQGFDLIYSSHVAALIEAAQGAALVVLDTLSACWSGDEDSNTSIAAFDRDVLVPLMRETGASPLVLDHTGNPQAFVKRQGVSAPRGASSKGQKADFLLEFRAAGDTEFTVYHGKARGTRKQPPRTFRVIDTDDGALDVIEVEASDDAKAEATADELVPLVVEAGYMTTKQLRAAMKKLGVGIELQSETMKLLENEDPARLIVGWEVVDSGQGRQRAKVWRPAASRGFPGGSQGVLEPPGEGGDLGGSEGVPLENPQNPLQVPSPASPQGVPNGATDPDEVERLAELASQTLEGHNEPETEDNS